MSEFHWTAAGYVKIARDNLYHLNRLVDLYSPTLPLEDQRDVLRDAARFAQEVADLSLKAWEKVQREDGGA